MKSYLGNAKETYNSIKRTYFAPVIFSLLGATLVGCDDMVGNGVANKHKQATDLDAGTYTQAPRADITNTNNTNSPITIFVGTDIPPVSIDQKLTVESSATKNDSTTLRQIINSKQ